jgi:hypothetical protein
MLSPNLAKRTNENYRSSFRGASKASEPGIHNHGAEYGFRARAKRRIPE